MRPYATSACGLNYKLLVYAKTVACSAVDVKPSHSIRSIRIRMRRIRVTERLCECKSLIETRTLRPIRCPTRPHLCMPYTLKPAYTSSLRPHTLVA